MPIEEPRDALSAVIWPGGAPPAGRAVIARRKVRAIDMRELRRARAIIAGPGQVSEHAVYIAHQLGIPVASAVGPSPNEGDHLLLTTVSGEKGYGVGTEAADGAAFLSLRRALRESPGVSLDMLVGVTRESFSGLPREAVASMQLLFCSEHAYALSGINPFRESVDRARSALDAALADVRSTGCTVVFRTADVDPAEFGEEVSPDRRGLRRLLEHRDLFAQEIRAAAGNGLPVCFSFVRTAAEWEQATEIALSINPKAVLGLMAETPLIATHLADLKHLRFACLGLGDLRVLLTGSRRGGWVNLTRAEETEIQEYVIAMEEVLLRRGVRLHVPFVPMLADSGDWKCAGQVYIRDLGQSLLLEAPSGRGLFRPVGEKLHYAVRRI